MRALSRYHRADNPSDLLWRGKLKISGLVDFASKACVVSAGADTDWSPNLYDNIEVKSRVTPAHTADFITSMKKSQNKVKLRMNRVFFIDHANSALDFNQVTYLQQ